MDTCLHQICGEVNKVIMLDIRLQIQPLFQMIDSTKKDTKKTFKLMFLYYTFTGKKNRSMHILFLATSYNVDDGIIFILFVGIVLQFEQFEFIHNSKQFDCVSIFKFEPTEI
jgi:hypothetical protein